jgi:hypothetical protein
MRKSFFQAQATGKSCSIGGWWYVIKLRDIGDYIKYYTIPKFGSRRIVELEQTFLYLSLYDGGLLKIPDHSKNLQVKQPMVQNL